MVDNVDISRVWEYKNIKESLSYVLKQQKSQFETKSGENY